MTAPPAKRIKVLVVEDSPTVRELLVQILTEAHMEVIGVASNGEEALAALDTLRPDVITMDINMPKMDGFEATRRIMERHPTPIVIVSGTYIPREVEKTFRAFEAGALAVLERPRGLGHPHSEAMAEQLVKTVRAMSEVKVVRRRRAAEHLASPAPRLIRPADGAIEVVAIGASTGGPLALKSILSALPGDFPAPVLIVQHMARGFIQGFVHWLSESCSLSIRVAEQGEVLSPGGVWVAPDNFHMGLSASRRICLKNGAAENFVCPSVSHLFRSVAGVCGGRAIGVILSGMGRDGAAELKQIKAAGGATIAQDKATSVIHGMPGAAIELGAAGHVLPLEEIPGVLIRLVKGP